MGWTTQLIDDALQCKSGKHVQRKSLLRVRLFIPIDPSVQLHVEDARRG